MKNALEIGQLRMRVGAFCLEVEALAVGEGEYFVLMGMTGSGKSLLLKAICGLARIDAGAICVGGREVSGLAPRLRRIGYVPQESGLFPHLDVLQNIVFPVAARRRNRLEAARGVGGVVESLRLSGLLDRRVQNLSGGERQKVALARALARKPDLLVLDEPVSALDEPTRRDICRELHRVQREFGIATLHVCHSREEAEMLADRVGVMEKGRLLDTGTVAELTASRGHEAVCRLFQKTEQRREQ